MYIIYTRSFINTLVAMLLFLPFYSIGPNLWMALGVEHIAQVFYLILFINLVAICKYDVPIDSKKILLRACSKFCMICLTLL